MEKKLKTILIVTLSLFACATPEAPKMERPILVWNGSPENIAICHVKTEAVASSVKGNSDYFDIPGLSKPQTCMKANDKTFKEYAAILFTDVEVVQRYIEKLRDSCAEWK